MRNTAAVIAGLLDRGDRAWVAAADWAGPDAAAFAPLKELGWVGEEPLTHPLPVCPYCRVGTPHPWPGRAVCDECQTVLDPAGTRVWPFRGDAFAGWLAGALGLTSDPRPLAVGTWQLGTLRLGGQAWECFYRGGQPLGDPVRRRVAAYRNALVVCGFPAHVGDPDLPGRHVLLGDVLTADPFGVRPPEELLSGGGRVRFDPHAGGVWAGAELLGEVPPGTREYYLLARLAAEMDTVVPYADLKHFVTREAGSADRSDDATFCHKLKGRIKAHWVPAIDAVLVGSSAGGGYRLRAVRA